MGYFGGCGGAGQVQAGAEGDLDSRGGHRDRESAEEMVELPQTCTELRREPRLHSPALSLYNFS